VACEIWETFRWTSFWPLLHNHLQRTTYCTINTWASSNTNCTCQNSLLSQRQYMLFNCTFSIETI
jgi:hypothetical protein